MVAKPLLFVYGTLHPEKAPDEISATVKRFKRVGEGTIRGHFEQMSDYPTVRIGTRRASKVPGTVFEIPSDPEVLQDLDTYEEFKADDPAQSLFVRRKVNVSLSDGAKVRCWVYVYNRPLAA